MTQLATALKALAAVVVVSTGAIAGGFYTGAIQLQEPEVEVQDIGDWGEVTDQRTEIITTLWVQNPNQFGISLGGNVRASYQLYLNEVNLAEGEKSGITIQSGNNTVELSTEVRNQKIPEWWVAFIQNNETIPVRAVPTATVYVGPFSTSSELPTQNETIFANSTPVISSLSTVASMAENRYTTTVSQEEAKSKLDWNLLPKDVRDEITDRTDRTRQDSETYTVGYEVQRGWATWGEVNEEHTVVYFHFIMHNPSEKIPVPAEPDHLKATVQMNDIEMFRATGDDTSLLNPKDFSTQEGTDKHLLQPKETKEVVYAVQMDNNKIDEWFTSHARRNEQTDVQVGFQLLFSHGNTTFHLPEESKFTYSCKFHTGILVDDQDNTTTCLKPESVPGVETGGPEANGDDGADEPTATETPTATEIPKPEAHIQANPKQGEAPLTVEFDGSQSTDPNDDIRRYVWRFKDGSSPAEGKTVTHTFRTRGTYEVELTVIDSEGNRDTATVTIEVERRGM